MIGTKGIKFYLNFITDGFGRYQINEPIGFADVDFNLQQEKGRFGRDISFSGGEREFVFTRKRHDIYFDKLEEYFDIYGYEAKAQIEIEISTINYIIGDVDFQSAVLNKFDKFTCRVIQDSSLQLIKRRSDIKVNLFGDKTIDGDSIEPCKTSSVLLKAKPIRQVSDWTMGDEEQLYECRNDDMITGRVVMPILKNELTGIKSTLTGNFETSDTGANYRSFRGFDLLRASTSLTDFSVTVDYDFDIENYTSGFAGQLNYKLIGVVLNPVPDTGFTFETIIAEDDTSLGVKTVTGSTSFEVPLVNENQRFDVHLEITINNVTIDRIYDVKFRKMDVKVVTNSVNYNTKINAVRIIDAIKYVNQSIAGLDTDFPLAENEADLYNQFLFNGNLLRGLNDRPFYITFDTIKDWIKTEINGDYEIDSKNEVYYDVYSGFYKDEEIGVYDVVEFDDYTKTINTNYAVNSLKIAYGKYQSQKEQSEENSFDIIHGESEWVIKNVFAENTINRKVNISRDAFLIELVKGLSLTLDGTTSSQDDDTLFLLDCVEYDEESVFKETTILSHSKVGGKLHLTNDNTINWLLFGFNTGDEFNVLSIINNGTYIVDSVISSSVISLTPTGFTPLPITISIDFTTYEYTPTDFTYTNRTTEGFTAIEDLLNGDDYANLRFTVKRNIINYFNQYLATCNIFHKEKTIDNTFYKNNPSAFLQGFGIDTTEGESFIPSNPILTPYIHKRTLIMDYKEYFELEQAIRSKRGYIRIYDAQKHPVKIYPNSLKFSFGNRSCEIEGEERFGDGYIDINYNGTPIITLNNGEYTLNTFRYEENRNKISIFDESNRALYPPIFWQKVSFNGVFAESLEELKGWMDLIL